MGTILPVYVGVVSLHRARIIVPILAVLVRASVDHEPSGGVVEMSLHVPNKCNLTLAPIIR